MRRQPLLLLVITLQGCSAIVENFEKVEADSEYENIVSEVDTNTDSDPVGECGALNTVNHATLDDSAGYALGNKAVYACEKGFYIEGQAFTTTTGTLTCGDDGWGETPVCARVVCEEPSIPVDGEIVSYSDGQFYGSTVEFACVGDEEMHGEPTRICQLDGTWNGTTPACGEVYCPEAGELENGKVTLSSPDREFESEITYTCDDTFHVAGLEAGDKQVTYRCEGSGQWGGEAPTCEPVVCPEIELGENVVINEDDYSRSAGSEVTFSCEGDNLLNGPDRATCGNNGVWSDVPACEVLDCCSINTCEENGKWGGSDPSCESTCEWSHLRPISLTGVVSGRQMMVRVPPAVYNSYLLSEVRFSNSFDCQELGNGKDDLDYYIEDWDSGAVWVKLNNSSTSTIYMFYGNGSASDHSVDFSSMFPESDSLIMDKTSELTKTGNQNYAYVKMDSGAVLDMGAKQVLRINAQKIVIDEDALIRGNGQGYENGDYYTGQGGDSMSGGAGGGGGYGGDGGKGGRISGSYQGGPGGGFNGDADDKSIRLGSSGGEGYYNPGSAGVGGGAVELNAQEIIINGKFEMNGAKGADKYNGGGGGSGGGVLIVGNRVTVTTDASFNVMGGRGGNSSSTYFAGGGGGSGGRVKIFHDTYGNIAENTAIYSISGGAKGGSAAQYWANDYDEADGWGGSAGTTSLSNVNPYSAKATVLEQEDIDSGIDSNSIGDTSLDENDSNVDMDTATDTDTDVDVDTDTDTDPRSDTDTIQQESNPDGCYLGSYRIQSVEEIDAFSDFHCIWGDLFIGGDGNDFNNVLTDLRGLEKLEYIRGSLYIASTNNLVSLAGLENLRSISRGLFIRGNMGLPELSGLNSLSYAGNLLIWGNDGLTNFKGLETLKMVSDGASIDDNQGLVSFHGLSGLEDIGGDLQVSNHPMLLSLDGLDSLSRIGGTLTIRSNESLMSLLGLGSLEKIGGLLTIGGSSTSHGNANLSTLSGLSQLRDVDGYITILNNQSLSDCEICDLASRVTFGHRITRGYGENSTEICADTCIKERVCYDGSFMVVTSTDIAELGQYDCVSGDVEIRDGSLPSMEGLEKLSFIGGRLIVRDNNNLRSLNGLNNLETIRGSLQVVGNQLLELNGELSELGGVIGGLIIASNNRIADLSGLENVKEIRGYVNISNNEGLVSLAGLNSIELISGSLHIGRENGSTGLIGNPMLEDISALASLTRIDGDLWVRDNDALMSLSGLENLTHIRNTISIMENDGLVDLTGLKGISEVGEYFDIRGNDNIGSLRGVENLRYIQKGIVVGGIVEYGIVPGNHSLKTLDGLENIRFPGDYVYIYGNSALPQCEVESWLSTLLYMGSKSEISPNGTDV